MMPLEDLKAHSLVNWKPFKNDEKCILFHLKSSFLSQDIFFVKQKKKVWLER